MSDESLLVLMFAAWALDYSIGVKRNSKHRKMVWLIAFTMKDSQECGEYELFHGTYDDALNEAVRDNRHVNYGRRGFSIIAYDH